MKLSKTQHYQTDLFRVLNQPIFTQPQARFNRLPEFEFIRLAELTLNQKLTICRKNTYLIG